MAQMRRENTRITGRNLTGTVPARPEPRANMAHMTPEQKAQRQAETEAGYQAWLEARRARLMRLRLLRR